MHAAPLCYSDSQPSNSFHRILKHQVHKVMGSKLLYSWTDPWNVWTELVATIKHIRLTVISRNIAAVALMWKAAGGVRARFLLLEAALPTRASQRKSAHSSWKVPSGARVWMDTTAKTLPTYHMLHDLRTHTHTHTHLGFHLWKDCRVCWWLS